MSGQSPPGGVRCGTPSRPRLYDLPTEVQYMILLNLTEWSALQALIRASALHYRIYKAAKATVIPCVVRNQANSNATNMAVYMLHQPPKEQFARSLTLNQRALFVRRPEPLPSIDLDTARFYLSFEKKIHDCVTEFFDYRLSTITVAVEAQNSLHHATSNSAWKEARAAFQWPLSFLERSRISRALHTLDLYRYVCGGRYPDRSDEKVDAVVDFLGRMPHFEREEFLCVCQFFLERLRDYQESLETEYMESFVEDFMKSGPRRLDRDPRETLDPDWMFAADDNYVSKGCFEELGLTAGIINLKTWYQESNPPDRYLSIPHLVEEGVLLSGNGLDHLQPEKLTDLYAADISCSGEKGDGNTKCPSDETPSTANDAYIRLLQHFSHSSDSPEESFPTSLRDPNVQAMRRWGYAIWDRERLDRSGILAIPIPDVISAFHLDLSEWQNRRSVEERIYEQAKIWKRQGLLSEEFCSTRDHLRDL